MPLAQANTLADGRRDDFYLLFNQLHGDSAGLIELASTVGVFCVGLGI
jgi:hypothetical protein